ncbi:MAG: hypothetical protein QME66_00690 [Candidatus Eisenbacteria bacterium]|nr:hypothetical protein [Candidatus Eisenbacteria bacterium]
MQNNEAAELRRQGTELLRKSKLDSASKVFEKLLDHRDAAPYDFVVAADTFAGVGQLDKAVTCYERAVDSYEKEGLNVNAAAVCKKIIRLGLGGSGIHERLGRLYMTEGFVKEAQGSFLTCAELRARQGEWDTTLEALASASEESVLDADSALRLSELLVDAGRKKEAAAMLRSHLGNFESSRKLDEAETVREKLAVIEGSPVGETPALEIEDLEKIVREYGDILSKKGEEYGGHFELAQAYMEIDNYADAIEEFVLASREDSLRERSLELIDICREKMEEKEEEWF